MTITAINKKYQTKVTRMYTLYRRYHELVNQADTCQTEKESYRNELQQEKVYDKFLDIEVDIPSRESKNFFKQHKQIHGYI